MLLSSIVGVLTADIGSQGNKVMACSRRHRGRQVTARRSRSKDKDSHSPSLLAPEVQTSLTRMANRADAPAAGRALESRHSGINAEAVVRAKAPQTIDQYVESVLAPREQESRTKCASQGALTKQARYSIAASN